MNPTVDSIRDELRRAIFGCIFGAAGLGIEHRKTEQGESQQKACAFAAFGARTGLLTEDEGNDWLDAVWGRKLLPKVAELYMRKTETP